MTARALSAANAVERPSRAHTDALGVLIGYPSSELRKVHDAATGETSPARSPFRFLDIAETKPLADLDALAGVLRTLAGKPHAALIRGAPIADVPRPCRRLLHPRDGDPASVEDVPRSWLALDLDGAPAPRRLDFTRDPEATAAYLVDRYLPAPFLATSCVIQATGSAGIKPGLRCRLWFRLSRPITCGEAKRWLKPHAGVIDEAILQPVGIHYTATPHFIGRDDPMGWRVHVHESVFDDAPVPPAGEIAERAAASRCEAAQRARWQSPAYRSHMVETGLKAVAEAPEGERNHTLYRWACRFGEAIGAGALGADFAEAELVAAATGNGLDETEARATARSGLQTGADSIPAPFEPIEEPAR